MIKVELLAPAGDIEKLKIAILYGANAVYIGGKKFSLRARASNFEIHDIEEAVLFANKHHAKIYVTMNIVPHDDDLMELKEYLMLLETIGVTGIIVTSFHIATIAKEVAPKLELHLSTQQSIRNSSAIAFVQSLGFSRIVLAREVPIVEIKELVKRNNIEFEVFIHGGMCVSYSGRCMLSNHMTYRDANRGGCAHSCRWNYEIYDNDVRINKKDDYFNMGSKDLMAVQEIPALIKSGVHSLKIEGRMKSIYYIATVVRCYRQLIDEYYQNNGVIKDINYYIKEIEKAENRMTATGFLNHEPTIQEQLFNTRSEQPTKDFLGIVLEVDKETSLVLIEQRNYFSVGDTVEFFGPKLSNITQKIEAMWDENMELLNVARHPKQKIYIRSNLSLAQFDMMRKSY